MWNDVRAGNTEEMLAFIARAPGKVQAQAQDLGDEMDQGDDEGDDDAEDDDTQGATPATAASQLDGMSLDDAAGDDQGQPTGPDPDGWEVVMHKKRPAKKK